MKAAILQHATEGKMYQTRRSPSDPFIPVRVNTEKHVWIWDTLRQALDTDELVYFPQEYSRWCLGQYLKVTYAELVPTGRWHRDVGRARLDMHRTGNKLCTKSWGGSSTVRLLKP